MELFKHNDYELIYLIGEGVNEAEEIMFEKYKPLIYKKISKFNLWYDQDDMLQEGYMMLLKSLSVFDMNQRKTFTKYFEMNLERHYMGILSKKTRRARIYEEHVDYIFERNHMGNERSVYYELYLDEIRKILTKRENIVYTLRELENYSISFIKERLQLPEKTIYNSLHRAKMKIHSHFNN